MVAQAGAVMAAFLPGRRASRAIPGGRLLGAGPVLARATKLMGSSTWRGLGCGSISNLPTCCPLSRIG